MYNICIVGFGVIGPVHAEALKGLDDVNLYAICDIKRDRADDGAEKYGCKAYYDFEDVLSDPEIDSVHICTPHYLHFDMIKRTVDAKKIAVPEKPIAMKKEEFDILCRDYFYAPIYPVLQNRANTAVRALKNIVDTDESIGKLKCARCFVTWCRDESYYASEDWRGKQEFEGGGVLINQTVHSLDLMGYIGGGYKSVSATSSNKSLKGIIEVEDTFDARMIMNNGAIAVFYATNGFGESLSPQIDFYFENKTLSLNNNKLYCGDEVIAQNDERYLGKTCYGMGHQSLFANIYHGVDECITVADVVNTMNTMYAMYESASEEGEEIQI